MSYQDLIETPFDDFSNGLMSEPDAADLPLSASPDMQNFKITIPGVLDQRSGYGLLTSPGRAATYDGARFFFDSQGGIHFAAWYNGNLYDLISGAETLVASNVYSAGQRVCSTVRKGILFFSDGFTFYSDLTGIYTWDPTDGTSPNGKSVGFTPPLTGVYMPAPACKAMCVYNGSLVLGATSPSAGSFEAHNVRWSDAEDPSLFQNTNAFVVGNGIGGEINSLQPFLISTEALSPSNTLFVGKIRDAVFALKGATSQFSEVQLPCTDGVMDSRTVRFFKVGENTGMVVFLGTSKRVWITDGIGCSDKPTNDIRKELSDYIQGLLDTNSLQSFSATLIHDDFQYLLDVGGGRQYAMDYRTLKWVRYSGWPSGIYQDGENGARKKQVYCAYTDTNGNLQLAVVNSGTNDNGVAIDAYWDTPELRGGIGQDGSNAGSLDVHKRYRDFFIEFLTAKAYGCSLTLTWTANRGEGQIGNASIVIPASGTISKYDSGITYDSGAQYDTGVGYKTYKYRRPMAFTDAATGRAGAMNGYCMRIRVRQNQLDGYCKILAFQTRHQPRGIKRVATT